MKIIFLLYIFSLAYSPVFAAVSKTAAKMTAALPPGMSKVRTAADQKYLDQLAANYLEGEVLNLARSYRPDDEAFGASLDVRFAWRDINDSKHISSAGEALNKAALKLRSLLEKAPPMLSATTTSSCNLQDYVVEEASARRVEAKIQNLAKAKDYALARNLAKSFISELRCITGRIETKEYANHIFAASAAFNRGDLVEAKVQIRLARLNEKYSDDIYVVPFMRAKAFMSEAERLNLSPTPVSKERLNLLMQATQEQMNIAEILGYAKKGKVAPVESLLKMAQNNIIQEKENRAVMTKIASELKLLK